MNTFCRVSWPIKTLFIAAIAAAALYSLQLIILALSIYISYRLIALFLPSFMHSESPFFRLLFSFLFYIAFLQFVILSLWLVGNHNAPLSLAPAVSAIVLGVALVIHSKTRTYSKARSLKNNSQKQSVVSTADVTSIIFASLVSGIALVGALIGGQPALKSNIINTIGGNVDDVVHVSLLNDRLEFDRGIIFHTDAAPSARTGSMYPVGWHSVNALLIKGFYPHIETGVPSLMAYVVSKIVWFWLLILVITRTGLAAVQQFTKKRSALVAYCFALLYFSLFYIQIYMFGFYSFVPQILFTVVATFLFINNSKSTEIDEQAARITLSILFLVSATMSWFLPIPAIGVFVLYTIWQSYHKSPMDMLKKTLSSLPIYAIILLGAFAQYYALTKDKSTGTFTFWQAITFEGGISSYTSAYLILLIAGALVYALGSFKKTYTKELPALLIVLIFFAAFIYMAQQVQIYKNTYYFYKLEYLIIGIVIPFATAGILYLLNKFKTIPLVMSSLAAACIILMVIGIEPSTKQSSLPVSAYLTGKRWLEPEFNELVYKNLKNESAATNYYDNHYYFVYTPGAIDRNEISTLLMKANKRYSSCFDHTRETFLSYTPINQAVEKIQKDCVGNRVTIYTDPVTIQEFRRAAIDSSILTVTTYEEALRDYKDR